MVGKIEPRYGAEVYISDAGNICIKQDQGGREEHVLIFADEEVDDLIALLKDAKSELAEERRVAEENENN
ncbi:hypothetical protein [Pseudomonas agarici]|uniref:hypothetical protein n=1 Tax=Pseudomonas agarici TaxID=46677 RepID=UPI000377D4F1|nr:hypothetical protein [Pseudomonas agarici]NWB92297.1 hypothetical protein [Pseudomonas agarici]NWC11750.1 hypothetical protein [Pseudomonas agarici]SEL88506.1 hypothetical protein SAMN05216604_14514 [Pseudomonas agarici]SEL89173.1 hypothetical protein SAMN05216604_14713 [Pseudomonas agarici]SEL89639.1 hypothetical protein SAMN05216604_14811 [Pseudomonas agarici]